ncbi:MAG TPA: hypothetical protein GX010_01495 [Erysipelotrichaceae bacterium]|nr:hypothetical protein [Erysipelotrichaceae bacterium]
MKVLKRQYLVAFFVCLAMLTVTGCNTGGGKKEASTAFLYSASTFYEGTTYKLNLKGLDDNTCTLTCLQAETPIDLEGTWAFSQTNGYSFDFGNKAKVLSGYNSYTKVHYSNYTINLTATEKIRLMMTYSDDTFVVTDSYVDPYDVVQGVCVYEGNAKTTKELIKLRDFGDGTFDVISYGSQNIFDYGTYVDADGVRTYTNKEGTTFVRDVGEGTGNYRIVYITSVKMMFGSTNYENKLYHLSGDLDLDAAFPDPRGDKIYIFKGTNTNEFKERMDTYAAGSVEADLILFRNADSQQYELNIQVGTSDWFNQKGNWIEEGGVITFTSNDRNPVTWTGSATGNFDYVVQKSQPGPPGMGGGTIEVTFHFTLVQQ